MKPKPDTKILAIYKRLDSLKHALDYQKDKVKDLEERVLVLERTYGRRD